MFSMLSIWEQRKNVLFATLVMLKYVNNHVLLATLVMLK